MLSTDCSTFLLISLITRCQSGCQCLPVAVAVVVLHYYTIRISMVGLDRFSLAAAQTNPGSSNNTGDNPERAGWIVFTKYRGWNFLNFNWWETSTSCCWLLSSHLFLSNQLMLSKYRLDISTTWTDRASDAKMSQRHISTSMLHFEVNENKVKVFNWLIGWHEG